jgi:hypothetical protein
LGCVGEFEITPQQLSHDEIQIDFYEGGEIGQELIDLYNSEPSRYKRTATEFTKLMDAMPLDQSRPMAITAVAKRAGKPVAYVSGLIDKANNFKTVEFAGEAKNILILLDQMACRSDVKCVKISVQNVDARYDYFLKNATLKSMSHMDATFMVLDPKGLFDQVKPILENGDCIKPMPSYHWICSVRKMMVLH